MLRKFLKLIFIFRSHDVLAIIKDKQQIFLIQFSDKPNSIFGYGFVELKLWSLEKLKV